jgi:hypothetical protein
MANDEQTYMVLRDEDDNYFAVPREIVDHHRVRREWKAKIKQYLDGEDVEGFIQTAGGTAGIQSPTVVPGLSIVGIFTTSEIGLFEGLPNA